jgi:hypothetical protein
MMLRELTNRVRAARSCTMQGKQSEKRGRGAFCAAGVLLGSVLTLSACISVNAPDKPIVIELNINIKQEVIYRLAADAEKTIEANSGVF